MIAGLLDDWQWVATNKSRVMVQGLSLWPLPSWVDGEGRYDMSAGTDRSSRANFTDESIAKAARVTKSKFDRRTGEACFLTIA